MSIVPLQSILLLVLTVALLFNKICAMEVDSLPSSRSWAALVGKAGDVAASEIRKQFPDYKVHVVKHNSMVTMDLRMDRVRIFVDDAGKVIRPPVVG